MTRLLVHKSMYFTFIFSGWTLESIEGEILTFLRIDLNC
jgi:hypothetical protein